MGYRSDVALVLTKTGVEQFKATLKSQEISKTTRQEVYRLLKWADKHLTKADGSECWYWSDVVHQ